MTVETVKWIAKALVAAAIAFVGAVVTGMTDQVMTAAEWWSAVLAGLISLGSVFGIRNGVNPRKHPTLEE